jgi:uncharacterized protein
MYDYIIYHNNCYDGYTGFYLFIKSKQWVKNPIVYPDYPSSKTIPPNIDGKNVIIIDVAYSADILKKIANKANKVLFIDHHKTIIKDIKKLKLKPPHEIVYDVDECGATLVWKYFFSNKKMPLFLKYIRDNDIGIWEMDGTIDLHTYLEVNFQKKPNFECLKKWDSLFKTPFLNKAIKMGKIYNEYKQHIIKKIARQHQVKTFPGKKFKKIIKGKYTVAVLNNTCISATPVGKYVIDNYNVDFCMIWTIDKKNNKYIISFRSNEVDVGQIAKLLGGGGHKLASGVSLDKKKVDIDDLFE